MIRIEAAMVEIASGDPLLLAEFYTRVFGLSPVRSSAESVFLGGHGIALHIKRAFDDADRASGAPFGFVVSGVAEIERAREEAVAAGAVVISESKREGSVSLLCQDPSGNEFTLVTLDTTPAKQEVAVVATPPPRTMPTSPRRPPTRRDFDRLRDESRLASMQEAIAGLSMPFGEADPASTLDEMRAKLGGRVVEDPAETADAALRAHEREANVDEALKRYRDALRGEDVPNVAPAAVPRPERAEEASETDEAPPRRTLGRASRADDDEA